MFCFLSQFRFGFRLLRKNPGFAIASVLALAVGIGPNTAIFSVVYGNLLAPLPYPQPDQLVMIWSKVAGNRNQVSAADFLDWKRQTSSFREIAAFTDQDYNLSSTLEPQYIVGARVSTNWYKLLGETTWMGREFRSDEDQPGKDHVFILSHRCWMSKFGADSHIIGKQFRLNGESYTVIGVMPPGLSDRADEEIWLPLRFSPEELARGATFWYVIGRLKSGISIKRAQQEMNAVTKRIAELYPISNKSWGASVEPLKNDFLNPNTRNSLWLLLGAVICVLLIACANVANLLLARGATRRRELAVRAAMGASRAQLVWQTFAETSILALLGGIFGTALGAALVKVILVIVPPGTLSSEADVRLSLPVLLFTIATTIFSCVLFGCAPAWQARDVDVSEGLKQGGRTSMGAMRPRLRKSLVVLELALAVSLLTGAALMIHSFVNRMHVDLGIRIDHLLTFYLPVPQSKLKSPEQTASFYHDLLGKIEAIPGVQRAAVLVDDDAIDDTSFNMPFSVEGTPIADPSALPEAGFQPVTPGYFQTLEINIDRGRAFSTRDTANSPRVAIVNEAFAHQFLGGVDPLSRRLLIPQLQNGVLSVGTEAEWQIIGVSHDVQNGERVGQSKLPQIYVPFGQAPWPQDTVIVRTAFAPEKMIKSIAAAVHALDPNLPLANVKTMRQAVRGLFVEDRFGTMLYGSLAGIALLLASLGIYSVLSFAVAQSTPEIGLRMALGASSLDVLLRVLKQGLAMAVMGLGLGLLGAYLMGRAMQAILYKTGSFDWTALIAVAALLLIVALLACYVPAQRATRVDPALALREE